MRKILLGSSVLWTIVLQSVYGQNLSNQYRELEVRVASGWNSWSYASMLTQVDLPSAFSVTVNFRQSFIGTPYDPNYFLENVTVDKEGMVRPIAHTFDGSYSEMIIDNWYGNTIRIQTAAKDEDLVILITPMVKSAHVGYFAELQTGFLWNRQGEVHNDGNTIKAKCATGEYVIRSTGKLVQTSHPYPAPYFSVRVDSAFAFYTGSQKTIVQLKAIIDSAEFAYNNYAKKFGEASEGFKGIQSVLGWNTLYDADKDRVITPVTRGWNEAWQGYVLFEWDTYFAALLFALDNKDLAYSNAIAVTKGINELGAVPFTQMPRNQVSLQSQPPVGSMVCWMIYEKYKEKWFLKEVYKELLTWNRWWVTNRLNKNYLTWGAPWKNAEVKHAVLESGLDNSPMYEQAKVVEVGENSLLNIADIGLMSLYVADCKYLAKMAAIVGTAEEEKELADRIKQFGSGVQSLWDDEAGIYKNKFVDTDAFNDRISPTSFYPMIAQVPGRRQANRLIKEHFFNRTEFYGDYILPSCPYNDKSFDNNYWRGSIWGPMNFLVYVGLRNYDASAAKELADRSYELYIEGWKKHHYVFENINSVKGVVNSRDQINCDPFYHWGALMGLMKFIDENKY